MATVLESLAVLPRPSATAAVFSPRRSYPKLPQYAGLKPRPRPIASTRLTASPAAAARVVNRTARVVCEAQDTAVEG